MIEMAMPVMAVGQISDTGHGYSAGREMSGLKAVFEKTGSIASVAREGAENQVTFKMEFADGLKTIMGFNYQVVGGRWMNKGRTLEEISDEMEVGGDRVKRVLEAERMMALDKNIRQAIVVSEDLGYGRSYLYLFNRDPEVKDKISALALEFQGDNGELASLVQGLKAKQNHQGRNEKPASFTQPLFFTSQDAITVEDFYSAAAKSFSEERRKGEMKSYFLRLSRDVANFPNLLKSQEAETEALTRKYVEEMIKEENVACGIAAIVHGGMEIVERWQETIRERSRFSPVGPVWAVKPPDHPAAYYSDSLGKVPQGRLPIEVETRENKTFESREDTVVDDTEEQFRVYFIQTFIQLFSWLDTQTAVFEDPQLPLEIKTEEKKQVEKYLEELKSSSVTLILPFLTEEAVFLASDFLLDMSGSTMTVQAPYPVATPVRQEREVSSQELPEELPRLLLAALTADNTPSFSVLNGFEMLVEEELTYSNKREVWEVPLGYKLQDGDIPTVAEDFIERFAAITNKIFTDRLPGRESRGETDERQEADFQKDRKMIDKMKIILSELGAKNIEEIARLNLLVKMYESEKTDPQMKQVLTTLIYFALRRFLSAQEVKLNDSRYTANLQKILHHLGLAIEVTSLPIVQVEALARLVFLYFYNLASISDLEIERLPTLKQFINQKTRQYLNKAKKLKRKAILYQYHPAEMLFIFPPLEKPVSFVTQ